jgi:signal transduction histidine kinase
LVTQIQLGEKEQAGSRYNYAPLVNSFFFDQSLSNMLLIQPEDNSISVEFSALDYSAPERNRYAYRLDGYNKDWINTDSSRRLASYTNLPPGDYRLRLRGSNRDGVLSLQERVIPIRVLPAWYQTVWFMALALFIVSSTIFGIFRLRTRFLQRLIAARTTDILKLGKIGQELTSTLDTEQAFERVSKQVSARLDAAVFMIGIYDEETAQIVFVYEIVKAQRQPVTWQNMSERERPAVWCIRERRELVASNTEELLNYVSIILPPTRSEKMETVVYLPLMIEQRVIGCLSVQSLKKNAYDENQLEFLRVLASYTAITLSNSIAHGDLAAAHKQMQETQQQMLLQEKMAGLGTLTAGVAHEINNPTNFVHVAAQIQRTDIAEFQAFVAGLIEDDDSAEVRSAFNERFKKLEENVTLMLNGTERIKGIVRDLRAFTRPDESEKRSARLSECLTSTLNLVRTSWLEKVEFITDFTDDPEMECWPALLNQVFMNLMINGCQAIAEKQRANPSRNPPSGKLSIQIKMDHQTTPPDTITIIFEDDGVGMDEKTQARILEPFFTTKEVGSGTGLGLSIAFGILQKHGGNLTFTSTPGVGSQFTVHLPIEKPTPQKI